MSDTLRRFTSIEQIKFKITFNSSMKTESNLLLIKRQIFFNWIFSSASYPIRASFGLSLLRNCPSVEYITIHTESSKRSFLGPTRCNGKSELKYLIFPWAILQRKRSFGITFVALVWICWVRVNHVQTLSASDCIRSCSFMSHPVSKTKQKKQEKRSLI